jgi:hypothetical protein
MTHHTDPGGRDEWGFRPGLSPGDEALSEGGGWLLDLVSAVDYLGRGLRHDFSVWDALEEAARDWTDEHDDDTTVAGEVHELPWDAADPLALALERMLRVVAADSALDARVAFQQAVRRWVCRMAEAVNDGCAWSPPAPRRELLPAPLFCFDDGNT